MTVSALTTTSCGPWNHNVTSATSSPHPTAAWSTDRARIPNAANPSRTCSSASPAGRSRTPRHSQSRRLNVT